MLQKPSYVPIIKTMDAELRALENLDVSSLDRFVPLFELTKSRKTSKSPVGTIERRLAKIEEIYGDRPFILDLTPYEDQRNEEIESLVDDENNFDNWCTFIESKADGNLIPVVHVYDDSEEPEVAAQVVRLEDACGTVAFRMNPKNIEQVNFIEMILNNLGDRDNLIVVLDSGFVGQGDGIMNALMVSAALHRIDAVHNCPFYVVASSSFPSSVMASGYHEDKHGGEFNLEELLLYQALGDDFDLERIVYGDHASIHPTRNPIRGGTWIPRVDVPLEESIIFRRFPREDGGYARAAAAITLADEYDPIDCWGDDQIAAAAEGTPNGRSPSFWISVRMNIHLTRRIQMLHAG
jgi:hypothetical protein